MPRIDVFGWNLSIKKKPGDDGTNILAKNVDIPDWWSRPGMTQDQLKTRTKLGEQRRAERIPHISYDLDGDGYVGGKDYVVAKHFDKDHDGRLDASERKAAMEALSNVSIFSPLISQRGSSPSLSGTWKSRAGTDPSESCRSVVSLSMPRTSSRLDQPILCILTL